MGYVLLPLSVKVKTVSTEALFKTFNRKEVLGYCQQCSNYGNNYSCPDFDFDEEVELKAYPWVTLILTIASTEPLKQQWGLLSTKQFESQVSELHGGASVVSSVAIQAFNEIKDPMAEVLLEIEGAILDSLSSPPGSCTRCQFCLKSNGKACVYPKQLRYSLEAYGFLVSEIYKEFFALALEWSNNTLPDAYHSCSALFSKTPLDEINITSQITRAISGLRLHYTD